MGWTSYPVRNWTRSGSVDRKAECRDFIFGGLNSEWARKHRLLADAMDGSTYYAAVRDEDTGDVWACICMTRVENGAIFIKDLDETMAPWQKGCPERILDLLTPTDSEFANEWRKGCRENALRKKGFAALPLGARAVWTATFDTDAFHKGARVSLVKSRQSWRHKSPYVWLIDGTRWCIRPSRVDFTELEFPEAEASA